MSLVKILLTALILNFALGCKNQTKDKIISFFSSENRTGISAIEGNKFKIDTNIILNNNNLQPLIDDLEGTEIQEKKTSADIPIFIKTFLDTLTGDFSLANSDENWAVGCSNITITGDKMVYDEDKKDSVRQVTFGGLPSRQLKYFGLGKNIAVITYFTGGIVRTEHIAIVAFEETKIKDFWCGVAFESGENKEEIIKTLKEYKAKGTNIDYINL